MRNASKEFHYQRDCFHARVAEIIDALYKEGRVWAEGNDRCSFVDADGTQYDLQGKHFRLSFALGFSRPCIEVIHCQGKPAQVHKLLTLDTLPPLLFVLENYGYQIVS